MAPCRDVHFCRLGTGGFRVGFSCRAVLSRRHVAYEQAMSGALRGSLSRSETRRTFFLAPCAAADAAGSVLGLKGLTQHLTQHVISPTGWGVGSLLLGLLGLFLTLSAYSLKNTHPSSCVFHTCIGVGT